MVTQYRSPALYVHIPFCIRKCNYCDFVSYPPQGEEAIDGYCRALRKEIETVPRLFRPGNVSTLYFGGGTPTILPAERIEDLFKNLRLHFKWPMETEITIEANPGTIDFSRCRHLLELGFNRLSLGVQVFDNSLLEAMGRIHRCEDIYRSYHEARQAGFKNINIDLIFGLPGQTLTGWTDTVKQAISLEPEHISAYGLQVEEDTPWGKELAAEKLLLPHEEVHVDMYREGRVLLGAAGYQHYEISNFARQGHKCLHNLNYWHYGYYLGLGAAAFSFMGNYRWQNIPDLQGYTAALAAGEMPCREKEKLTLDQQVAEAMFMGLRLLEGVNLRNIKERFGVDAGTLYEPRLNELADMGMVVVEEDRVKLTDKALPLANEVFVHFI